MAIRLEDEYVYANPATADYPGGSFKDDSTGDTGDGTPLDSTWANDFLGFFQALLTTAGVVPSGAPDTALSSQYLQALQTRIEWTTPPGVSYFAFCAIAPNGFFECDGQTIGDNDSGANHHATWLQPLFNTLWGVPGLQLYNTAGNPVARGESAAVDWAAKTRLALPDMRGRFPRGWDHGAGVDAGRVLGSYQADSIEAHAHDEYVGARDADSGAQPISPTDGAGFVSGQNDSRYTLAGSVRTQNATGSTGGNETRPLNISGMWIIKY